MPTRKFCDLCDTEIENRENSFSIRIVMASEREFYSSDRDDYFEEGIRKPLVFETNMVCRKCITEVRSIIERIKRDALQIKQAKEVSVGEKAQDR